MIWKLDADTERALRMDRAREAMRAQRTDHAILELEEFLDRYPEDSDALHMLMECLVAMGDYHTSWQVFLQLLQLLSPTPGMLRVGVVCAFETCHFEQVEQLTELLERVSPGGGLVPYYRSLVAERTSPERVQDLRDEAHRRDPIHYPYPLHVDDVHWDAIVMEAALELPEELRAFWDAVPYSFEDLPSDETLESAAPPLSPRAVGLGTGSTPKQGGTAERPEGLRFYRQNLVRLEGEAAMVFEIRTLLEREATLWQDAEE